jgi:acetolactate synthase-1/2/3 large subunit
LNNDGYLSIKVTQKSFFKGHYVASEKTSGVTFPDFKKIADAYNIPYFEINTNNEISEVLESFIGFDGPCICQVFTDPDEIFEPRVVAKMDENGKFIPGRLSEAQWS